MADPAFLVTHSGGFHADEVLSSVILTKLFPAAKIIRTRDEAWITPAADRVIYDVGRAYDADQQIFDHHQKDAPLRESGEPYSSFGLVWKHYGAAYLAAMGVGEEHIPSIHQSFDRDFVLPVDLVDNGKLSPSSAGALVVLTLPVLLESLKPVFDDTDPMAEENGFAQAVTIARAFVEASINRKAAKRRAEAMVMQAIADAGESRILELSSGMPFRPAVVKAGADHLWFVICPRDTDWSLTGIRRDDEGFALRADLPVAWAGLTDAALEEASGVKGAKFCHNGRFIAVASSREAILAMANLAVQEAEAQV